MKILITEFMEAKSVEMLKRNFDVTVDKSLSIDPVSYTHLTLPTNREV